MLGEIFYLTSPTGIIGFNRVKTSEDEIYYTLKDYLGSIMAVASSTGTKLEEYSYDAWGRRRNISDWTYSSVSAPTYITRGYTGHEHIEEVGLINMNGRVYDPLVGLFLSPDPVVQSPGNALNYNRYSYAFNNPLKYTDPSGYYLELAYMEEARHNANKSDSYNEGHGGGSLYGAWYLNGGYSGSAADWASGMRESYTYNWETGQYENSKGQIVSRNSVVTNILLPGALVTKSGIEAQSLFAMFMEANFNVSFETAGNTVGFVAYEGLVPSGVIDAWTISGNGSNNVDANSGSAYSIDNAVNWLNDNAYSSWKDAKGKCATYIRWSLEAGFELSKDALKGKTVDQTGKAIGAAKTMGSYLEKLGFGSVNTTSYLKGDIAVIQGYPGGTSNAYGETYGHVQMYNGNIWISDFKQLRDFWPGGGYRTNQPSFVIYRWNN